MATMKQLNPFKGLEKPREVFAWGMFDFANQSFTLLIITLLFSVYVKEVVAESAAQGDALWATMHGGSLLVVVMISPVLGAWADIKGFRKRLLMITGFTCALLTCLLVFIPSAASVGLWQAVLIAALIYVPANVAYQLGENLLASLLPSVCSSRSVGRVSALGWSMGYAGALALLLITTGAMVVFGLKSPENWKPLFVFAGVWFALGIVPAGLMLKPDAPLKTGQAAQGKTALSVAVRQLFKTVRGVDQNRQLFRFLTAFFVYALGVQTMIAFASIIAMDFGFGKVRLVLFLLQITVTAGLAAVVTSRFTDRIGAKATVLIYLLVWIISTLGLVLMSLTTGGPSWPLWLIGNGIGFGLGGIGTASRAMVGRFTPGHRSAEYFGLWGVSYKLAGAVGVLSFGWVKATLGNTNALMALCLFFVVGLVLVLRVNERAGVRAAHRAERDHDRDGGLS